jgi:hypothetical protein
MREEIVNSADGLLETAFSHETMLEIMASGVSKRRGSKSASAILTALSTKPWPSATRRTTSKCSRP